MWGLLLEEVQEEACWDERLGLVEVTGQHRPMSHRREGILGITPLLHRLLPRPGRTEGNHRKGMGTTTGAGLAKAALQIAKLITVDSRAQKQDSSSFDQLKSHTTATLSSQRHWLSSVKKRSCLFDSLYGSVEELSLPTPQKALFLLCTGLSLSSKMLWFGS